MVDDSIVVPQSGVMNLVPPSNDSVGSYRRAASDGPPPRRVDASVHAEGTDPHRDARRVAVLVPYTTCTLCAKSIFVFVVGSPGRSSLI